MAESGGYIHNSISLAARVDPRHSFVDVSDTRLVSEKYSTK